MQAGLDGCEVGFPGGEAIEQLLPLLLAEGTVCAVADGEDDGEHVKSYSLQMSDTFTQQTENEENLTEGFLLTVSLAILKEFSIFSCGTIELQYLLFTSFFEILRLLCSTAFT